MSTHSRKPSSRAALPRRTTRGPLDGDDPLSPSSPITTPVARSPASSVISQVKVVVENDERSVKSSPPVDTKISRPESQGKDLSFLLDASIYHPLSQLEVPSPFRRPFPQLQLAQIDPLRVFEEIESLLSQCDYLGAAYVSGALLASGALKSTDHRSIFHALQIRYACLELSGNTLFAAQEAKALEDLSSGYYYVGLSQDEAAAESETDRPLPQHIMPFSLRLQGLKLQSIGFSDPRRGVASLYDLALECREHIVAPTTSEDLRRLWEQRLEEVGTKVVNALVEMGDLDCARRTLDTMKPAGTQPSSTWMIRKAMLCLRIGLLSEVQGLIDMPGLGRSETLALQSLIAIADDRLDDAVSKLMAIPPDVDKELSAVARQNAAVALLYNGNIQRAKELMETLIDEHESFSTLTINLATIYDLTSDRSKELKLGLASKVAADRQAKHAHSFTNADFKL